MQTDTDIEFSSEELTRYSRHLLLPEIGIEGQRKIKNAKVLIVGVGGLGSPAAMYLSAAGIGKLGIIDDDVVDRTNLHRQIIHSTRDVGKKKTESAVETIQHLNSHTEIEIFNERLTSLNAKKIFSKFDIILDGTDNFPTRYLINDAAVLFGKPVVFGSVYRFEGQVSFFHSQTGPCYRCLYPNPPSPNSIPDCAVGGVLGVVPGIIGTIQALEAIKYITGCGELLIGKLLLFDALRSNFEKIQFVKNPLCPLCGKEPTIHELIDYEQFCGVSQIQLKPENEISVEELQSKIERKENLFILDVRERNEYDFSNIGGTLIPLGELDNRIDELPKVQEIVVLCKTGIRSARAVELLLSKKFTSVKNLIGGISAWIERIDTTVPNY